MYWNAESVTVDDDEGRFCLVIEDVEGERVTVNIHSIDLDAFYDQVKARIGPYLREMHEARDAVARGVTLQEYAAGIVRPSVEAWRCSAEDVDESGGYDISDTKSPGWRERMTDLWDNRDKFERKPW